MAYLCQKLMHMEARAILQKTVDPISGAVSAKPVRTRTDISWKDFQRRYLRREDGFKYEWLNGTIEKTVKTMDNSQFFILNNLLDFFFKLKFQKMASGQLVPEGDIFFLKNHRRPDFAWLSLEQIGRTTKGENQVPRFVIEVISSNDMLNKAVKKMEDYRAAGVEVVWHIFPQFHQVHVYSVPDLRKMTVCKNDDLCSAGPALPAFELPCSEVFRKPS